MGFPSPSDFASPLSSTCSGSALGFLGFLGFLSLVTFDLDEVGFLEEVDSSFS